MSTTAPLAVVTLAGFSTGIEPCAAAVWMSSGESAVAVVSPGDFGFAVGTGVSAKPSASSVWPTPRAPDPSPLATDRKSPRLNSSHGYISYAVFRFETKQP